MISRLIGIKASQPIKIDFPISKANNSLMKQMQDGSHDDGWGIAYYSKLERWLEITKHGGKQQGEPWESYIQHLYDALDHIKSDLVIAHARKAIKHQDATSKFAQPFNYANKFCFAHDGTISKAGIIHEYLRDDIRRRTPILPTAPDYTDSEVFFRLIMQYNEQHQNLNKAIHDAVAFVKEHCTYTSLNFLLSDGKRLFAYCDASEVDFEGKNGHFNMYWASIAEPKEMIIISSEIIVKKPSINEKISFKEEWFKLEPGTLMVVGLDMEPDIFSLEDCI